MVNQIERYLKDWFTFVSSLRTSHHLILQFFSFSLSGVIFHTSVCTHYNLTHLYLCLFLFWSLFLLIFANDFISAPVLTCFVCFFVGLLPLFPTNGMMVGSKSDLTIFYVITLYQQQHFGYLHYLFLILFEHLPPPDQSVCCPLGGINHTGIEVCRSHIQGSGSIVTSYQ